jgi:NAD(P)-dependent dehydrogenase (short-subunit alcohol dehydrogenase family)
MQLNNKHVLLTGALGTIGRAQAVALDDEGAKLTLIDLPEHLESGSSFANSLKNATYVGLDLNDLENVKHWATIIAENSVVDILINNAAQIVNRPFQDFSLLEFETQLRINSSAAFVLAQVVSEGMKKNQYGKIINFCSLTLNGRWEGYVPYVTSKAALLGLTKTLARELGSYGICVNAISPGAVLSEAEQRVFKEKLEEYNNWILENQCIKKRIEPTDVAKLVIFLASSSSDMITGQNINIDGGW